MEAAEQQSGMKRIASTSSMAGIGLSNYGSIYNNVWRVLQLLSADPSPLVADMARKLVSRVRQKVSNYNIVTSLSSQRHNIHRESLADRRHFCYQSCHLTVLIVADSRPVFHCCPPLDDVTDNISGFNSNNENIHSPNR